MENDLQYPTQFKIGDITIDGVSVIGLFSKIEIFEDLSTMGITGSITIVDTDTTENGQGQGSFFEQNDIQFCEPIEFDFTNALGEVLKFKGKLNNLRSDVYYAPKRIYTIDFVSEGVHKNEMSFITKKYNNQTPNTIVNEVIKNHLVAEIEVRTDGDPMTFLGSRKKPFGVIKYVVNHGLTKDSELKGDGESKGDPVEKETGGGSGFLFWETIDGYRFCPINELLTDGKVSFNTWEGYKTALANKNASIEETMKNIMESSFPRISDYHSKLRSGQLKAKHTSMDMNTGIVSENTYNGEKVASKKLLDCCEGPTRHLLTTKNNEKASNECKKTEDGVDDKSEETLTQAIGRQNSFDHVKGTLTLPPQFEMRSGDVIDITINKVTSKDCIGQSDEKKTGKYVIKQVAHHIFSKGEAYTKVTIMRDEKANDTSRKSI